MAAKLIALARASRSVRRIIAHTMPERTASGRVLEKAGMRFDGEVIHPEDGRVWRWEMTGGGAAKKPRVAPRAPPPEPGSETPAWGGPPRLFFQTTPAGRPRPRI